MLIQHKIPFTIYVIKWLCSFQIILYHRVKLFNASYWQQVAEVVIVV